MEAVIDSAGEPRRDRLAAVLGVLGVALFSTCLDNYAYLAWSAPAPILAVEGFALASLVVIAIEPRRPLSLWRSPVAAWLCFYFVLTSLWSLWMRSSRPVVEQALYDRYRSMGFLASFLILFAAGPRRLFARALALACAFTAAENVAEMFGLVRFTGSEDLGRIAGRAGGLFINPNGAGQAIVLGLAVVLPRLERRWRAPLLLVGALGVAATFSRGCELSLAILVVWLLWRKEVPGWPLALAIVVIGGFLLRGSGALSALLESSGALNDNTWARLHFASDDSGRAELALKAWRLFTEAPLLGNGIGATIDWAEANSSHNQFLNLAADHGVLGLLAFPALGLAIAASGRDAGGFALVLMIAGMFSHNLLEDRSTLLAIAFAATGGPGWAASAGEPAPLEDRGAERDGTPQHLDQRRSHAGPLQV